MAKLDWTMIDTDTLPKSLKADYNKLRDTFARHKAEVEPLKASIEDAIDVELRRQNVVPEGHDVVVGYNFGRLSVAFVPVRETKAAAKTLSFRKR